MLLYILYHNEMEEISTGRIILLMFRIFSSQIPRISVLSFQFLQIPTHTYKKRTTEFIHYIPGTMLSIFQVLYYLMCTTTTL